ncbi:MAG: hypothetical protein K2M60_07955 [Lachnospiraceae bacterium]|nr:hypothetical protein [Lachnospiraceae bacterium]MDE6251358.1 hypothetical protein [Lachnospiraceae bacterium]
MSDKKAGYVYVIIGVAVLTTGLVMIKMLGYHEGIMSSLAYIGISLGCFVFGHGIGKICMTKAEKADPKLAKKNAINKKDERVLAIHNAAKAKAYDFMLCVFMVLSLAFALMKADMSVLLMIIGGYMAVKGIEIYYVRKFENEM